MNSVAVLANPSRESLKKKDVINDIDNYADEPDEDDDGEKSADQDLTPYKNQPVVTVNVASSTFTFSEYKVKLLSSFILMKNCSPSLLSHF